MTSFLRGLVLVLCATGLAGSVRIAAQGAEAADEPIACWWRTAMPAVRVGQPFDLVLTCAVRESAEATVVPDESRLDPAVAQFQPFEVLGGEHGPDLRGDGRRFFQYTYALRLLTDDAFGQDVALPPIEVPYRVDLRVDGETVPGRGRTYQLPPQSVRVLSLVPADAGDIRDAADVRFAAADGRGARASLLAMGAMVLLIAAAGLAAATLAGWIVRPRRQPATARRRFASDTRILTAAARELADVHRVRQATGWNEALAARAAAAIRVAAAYSTGEPVTQTPLAAGNGHPRAGQLLIHGGLARRRRVAVSAATTARGLRTALDGDPPPNGNRVRLEAFHAALADVGGAQYGPPGAIDEDALDAAVAASVRLARRLAVEHTWPLRPVLAWWTSWRH